MALKLATNYKGVSADYWTLTNIQSLKKTNVTLAVLSLYVSKQTRDDNIDNELDSKVFTFSEMDLTRVDIYAKIKESKLIDSIETNEFVTAIDC